MNYAFPQYRDRYLPALSLSEIKAIPDKEKAIIIIPTGAVEQHGPHLPVGVDALLSQAWLNYALPKVGKEIPVYVTPPIMIGKSNEHTGFPGTLILSKKMLRRQILTIALQVKAWGFKKIGILNTHGGNVQVVEYTLRELQSDHDMIAQQLRYGIPMNLSDQEKAYGFHANEVETSLMIEIMDGKSLDLVQAVCEYPARLDDPGELRPEGAAAIFSWVSFDLSQSGIMGDAPKGTAEKGKRWMEDCSTRLAEVITEFYNDQ